MAYQYRTNAAAEPAPAARGIDADGKPVFVGLRRPSSESGDAWDGFLTGLGESGLRAPLLVISDGAPGLIGAVERTMGAALRQRCLIHVARNILAKVPKNAQAELKADYWAISSCPTTPSPAWRRPSRSRPVSTRSPCGGVTPTPRRCGPC